jgi:hypothetical protein
MPAAGIGISRGIRRMTGNPPGLTDPPRGSDNDRGLSTIDQEETGSLFSIGTGLADGDEWR